MRDDDFGEISSDNAADENPFEIIVSQLFAGRHEEKRWFIADKRDDSS